MSKPNEIQADSLFAEMRRLSPQVTGGIMRAREATYTEGKVPRRYKLLTAVVASIVIRCEPCIEAYVRQAVAAGATPEEFIEFLNVAMTMQGCPGEEWALKAYRFYKSTQALEESESCCTTEGIS